MNRLSFFALTVLSAFALTGCFFTQEAPKNTLMAEQTVITGNVVLEDMTVSNQGGLATIQAAFYKQTTKQTEPVNAFYEPLRFGSLATGLQRAPQCQVAKVARETPTRATEVPISVGQLFFGPVLQENLMRLELGNQNIYQGLLETGLPAGAYQVVADGTEAIAPFGEFMTVPEQLDWVRVNGIDFGEPIMEYRKGEDLEVSWREPTVSNSENRILIVFVGRTEKETFYLACEAEEAEIMAVKNLKTWTIDRSFLTELPKKSIISIQLTRGHVLVQQRKTSLIRLQGLRTFYSKLDFTEN
jgi:hypothetical protein